MKLKCTWGLLLFLLTFAFTASAQHTRTSQTAATSSPKLAAKSPLTGVWRGFFTSGMGFFQDRYKYEVQIGHMNNNGLKGVTYSYKTTVFYGKANLAGMYTPATRNLVLKENKLIEVKMAGGEACLMTCYLEYSKVGDVEILEGTFTSININNNTDCGSGKVYLQKVPDSDFYKEDFVKEFETKQKPSAPVAKAPVKTTPPAKTSTTTTTPRKQPVINKPAEENRETTTTTVAIPAPPGSGMDEVVIKPVEETRRHVPVPRVIRERENKLAKKIEAEAEEIVIELYDNGQIDNDTISVYHNNQLVVSRKRLCHQPITIRIKADPRQVRNEFVMVAENLGSIPPNTALMVISVGKQRHEVTITSTEQRNAVVIIDCKIPPEPSR